MSKPRLICAALGCKNGATKAFKGMIDVIPLCQEHNDLCPLKLKPNWKQNLEAWLGAQP